MNIAKLCSFLPSNTAEGIFLPIIQKIKIKTWEVFSQSINNSPSKNSFLLK
jgi:hypothetical protein